jgi:hypothetical protein
MPVKNLLIDKLGKQKGKRGDISIDDISSKVKKFSPTSTALVDRKS